MNRASRVFIMLLIIAATGVFSCSDSEHRIPFGYARAVINLNLPPETPDAQAGLIERIRRFLVPDAIAQSAPASFSNINVRVTGPDMALIEKSFAPYSTISLSVPAGALRIFEVIAYVAPGDPSAALSFRGTSSANCPAGATVNVPVVMGLNTTKIVIPDYMTHRLIQINDMDGTGWVDRVGTEIGLGFDMYLSPYDVDFDNNGRIYIANNNYDRRGIIRLANIFGVIGDGTSSFIYTTEQIRTVTIDRARNILYYSDGTNIFRSNLDGSSPVQLINTPPSVQFMKVGSGGMLYITSWSSGINKYDPFTQSNQNANPESRLFNPWGVLTKGDYVYVANPLGADDYLIVQYNSNLEIVNGYGTQTNSENTNRGMFYGPRNFVAILNDEITIMDDVLVSLDKLISMNDMAGSFWKTYGSSGTGEGFFRFYSSST